MFQAAGIDVFVIDACFIVLKNRNRIQGPQDFPQLLVKGKKNGAQCVSFLSPFTLLKSLPVGIHNHTIVSFAQAEIHIEPELHAVKIIGRLEFPFLAVGPHGHGPRL